MATVVHLHWFNTVFYHSNCPVEKPHQVARGKEFLQWLHKYMYRYKIKGHYHTGLQKYLEKPLTDDSICTCTVNWEISVIFL